MLEGPLATDPGLVEAIRSPSISTRVAVGRILTAIAASPSGLLLILDDIHRIHDRAALDALAELIAHLPGRAMVHLAGRHAVALPWARWRTEGWLVEIGPDQLTMDAQESDALLRQMDVTLSADELERLVRRTEGWPALVALAGLAADRASADGAVHDAPLEALIADYLRSELLAQRTPEEIRFLTRTSILERLNGSVCDAVVGAGGSQAILDELSRTALLVDRYEGWVSCHSLLREVLAHELEHREPGLMPELHRRAAAWFQSGGDLDAALGHAFAAGDIDQASTLVGQAMLRNHWSGRRATTLAWLARFSDEDLLARPWLAVLAAWETLSSADPSRTERFAQIAERGSFEGRPPDGTASFTSGRAILRSAMVRGGAAAALSDATSAVELERAGRGAWLDMACWMLALARQMHGDADGADRALEEAIDAAAAADHPGLQACLLGHRAFLAFDRHDPEGAGSLLADAAGLGVLPLVDGYLSSVPGRIAEIRWAIHRREHHHARQLLGRAASLRPMLMWNVPGTALLLLLGLARAHLAVGDGAGAITLLNQADAVIRRRPDVGVLATEVASLRATVRGRPLGPGSSTLTTAELRVLSMLPYYLSFKEIAQRLGVTESTIKTHAMSIYGKLEATSRSEAVERAVGAGLLDPFVLPGPALSSVRDDAGERRR